MRAHFIDVGQGAATLLEFPCGAVLIDAGAQDVTYEARLLDYLDRFFSRRSDLNRTLDLVAITHAHIDHNIALDNVLQRYTVKNYVDNGLRNGSGRFNQKWAQDNAANLNMTYASYSFESIVAASGAHGYTDSIIDPLDCDEVDPVITLFAGRFDTRPAGWTSTAFKNGNNHSLVIRAEFGSASFLFTGDLEETGLRTLVMHYDSANVLDSDVLHVGHHGSHNATTSELLAEVTASHAVISCGRWNYGLGPDDPSTFNTYKYGHPRIVTIELLAASIPGNRSTTIEVMAAERSKEFRPISVRKRIYATPWDGTINVRAESSGAYRVTRFH